MMQAGDTIRFSNVTTLDQGLKLGWKAGGQKPRRRVYVALVLGTELHPDDIPPDADWEELYRNGTLLDPTEALNALGLKEETK